MMKKRFGIALLVLGLLAGVGLVAHHVSGKVHKEKKRDGAHRANRDRVGPIGEKIYSTLLAFDVKTLEVPKGRAGSGGGLTHMGNSIIVMTHDGRLFEKPSGKNEVQKLNITLPPNNLEKLIERAKSPEYKKRLFEFESFRYHNILFYRDQSQQGLLISYTEWDDDNVCYRTAVAHLPLPMAVTQLGNFQADGSQWKVIFRTSPCLGFKDVRLAIAGQMAGAAIAYQPGGSVFLASGDYEFDGVEDSRRITQTEDNDYGKVLKIDLATGDVTKLGLGLRNMQGMVIDPHGDIFTVEHGPRGGDELNLIKPGKNYGWPEATLGTRYNTLPWPGKGAYGRHDGFEQPVFAWLPAVAPSSFILLKDFNDAWEGDFIVGTLKDQAIYRVRIIDGRVLFAERIPVGNRIRSVQQMGRDQIFLWTDDYKLLVLTVSKGETGQLYLTKTINERISADAETKTKLLAEFSKCSQCHYFDSSDVADAPTLGKIYGAPIASGAYKNYSQALRNKGGTWNEASLRAFLTDVQTFAPGSAMPNANISDPSLIPLIIETLEKLTSRRGR